jgi:deoxyribonuclease V
VAIGLQKELAVRVDTQTPLRRCRLVAGADVSYDRFSDDCYAGVVVLRADDLSVVEKQGAVCKMGMPYIPGLLSFREAPAILQALAKVRSRWDVLLMDGQGIAHPRRFGIASHVGLWLGRPTIGCGKSLLCGEFKDLGDEPGDIAPLIDRGDVIGMAVRTKKKTKPIFVSVGHLAELGGAIRRVLACLGGYRIPEPTRQAHLHVNELRRQGMANGQR